MLHIWRTMYECHHAQNKISQQLHHATVDQKWHLSNDYHCQPAHQLETEVTFWHHSFCKLVQSQRDYVRTLCRWIQLTDSLADIDRKSVYSSSLHRLCEGWQHGLDRIPYKVLMSSYCIVCWISRQVYASKEKFMMNLYLCCQCGVALLLEFLLNMHTIIAIGWLNYCMVMNLSFLNWPIKSLLQTGFFNSHYMFWTKCNHLFSDT